MRKMETKLMDLAGEVDRLEASNKALREALEGVIRVADRKTVEFDAACAALAEGETP